MLRKARCKQSCRSNFHLDMLDTSMYFFSYSEKNADKLLKKEFTQDSSGEHIQKSYERISKTKLCQDKNIFLVAQIDFPIVLFTNQGYKSCQHCNLQSLSNHVSTQIFQSSISIYPVLYAVDKKSNISPGKLFLYSYDYKIISKSILLKR